MSKNISKKVLAQLALVLGFTSFSLSANYKNFNEGKDKALKEFTGDASGGFKCKKYSDNAVAKYLDEPLKLRDFFVLSVSAPNLDDQQKLADFNTKVKEENDKIDSKTDVLITDNGKYLAAAKLFAIMSDNNNELNFAAYSFRINGGLNIEFSKGMFGGGLDVVVGGNLPQSFGLVTKKDKNKNQNQGQTQGSPSTGNTSSKSSKENLLLMKEKLHITLRPYLVVYIKDFFARLGYTCNLSFFEADKKEHRVEKFDDKTVKQSSGFVHAHGFNFVLGYSFTKNVALVGILDVTFNMKAKDKSAQQAQSGNQQSQQNQNQNQKDSKDKLSASGMNIAFTVNLIGRFAHSSGLKVGAMFGAGYGYQSFKFESLTDLVKFGDVVSRINDQQGKQK